MKIVEPTRHNSRRGTRVWGGKVRVVVQGMSINGLPMSALDDMPSKGLTIEGATIGEVYELIRSIVEDVD